MGTSHFQQILLVAPFLDLQIGQVQLSITVFDVEEAFIVPTTKGVFLVVVIVLAVLLLPLGKMSL